MGRVSLFLVNGKWDDLLYVIKKYQDICLPKNKNIKELRELREAKALIEFTHPNIVRCYNWWLEKSESL